MVKSVNILFDKTNMVRAKRSTINNLEAKLGYKFKNIALLEQALTHKSATENKVNEDFIGDYQRLEFVGDAALGLFIAEELYNRYPQADEGSLTQWRANMVNRDYLAKLAIGLEINLYLRTSANQTKVKNNVNVLADVMEAIIAAIFFDGGFESLRKTLGMHLKQAIENIHTVAELRDVKSQLQEYLQQRKWPLPIYENVLQTGPKHQPTFVVQIKIPSFHNRREKPIYSNFGEGDTRKTAERQAATKALIFLQSVDIIIDES